MSREQSARIVIVDDDPADTYVMRRAFAKAAIPAEIDLIADGQAFVDFYAGSTNDAPAPTRQLVLLDINMPILNGFDALRALDAMGVARHAPILMFSTSSEPDDIARAYDLGVNGYVKKPGTIEEAETLAVALDAYWLKANIALA